MLYNDGIFKMFGYKASEIENVVDWWNEKLHPEDHLKVQRLLRNIFENGLQRFQFTYRFRCADGSYKYIFDRAFVLFDDEGKPGRMIGAMQDITYQKEEEIRIEKTIIQTQETERHEIGMELHDNVNQVLSTSLLYLGMAKDKQGNNTKAIENIESGRKYIGEAINEIRRLSHMLAPASFNDAFLKEDFESLINAININNQFTVQLHFESFEKNTVSYEVQINLYRILQEQLINIIKYAKATTVAIDVTLINKSICLRIADNGKGFDVKTAKNGNGLRNMQRRAKLFAGEVTISSSPGLGCEIIVTLPLNDAG